MYTITIPRTRIATTPPPQSPLPLLDPDEAAYRTLPAVTPGPRPTGCVYLSAQQWLTHARKAIAAPEALEVIRRERTSSDAVLATVTGLMVLARADGTYLAGIDALVEASGNSHRAVHRTLNALTALGVLHKAFQGRLATLAERMLILATGRTHRRWRSVYQLVHQHEIVHRPASYGRPHAQGKYLSTSPNTLSSRPSRDRAAARPSKSRARPVNYSAAANDLFDRLREESPTWRRTSPRRMLPTLTRFANGGWAPRALIAAINDVIQRRGWSVPDRLPNASRWLLRLLADVDHTGPSITTEREAATRTYSNWRTEIAEHADPCRHGIFGGHLTSPKGTLHCRFCREAE